MSKESKIKNFDPNDLGDRAGNIYGLPFTTEEAEVVIIPVPWEVTVSYGSGTAKGPMAVYNASFQVDLYDPYFPDAWKIGIAMDKFPTALKKKSDTLRKSAEKYISSLEKGQSPDKNKALAKIQQLINKECETLNKYVKQTALSFINKNKIVGLLGGDHSTPLGYFQALSEKYKSFGILQIDAHADLRVAFEGFTYSHASIMYNALKIKNIEKLVQVGVRDYCEQEANLAKDSKGRVVNFYDRDIKHQMYEGITWKDICKKIVMELPNEVYVSFDIDGLDPKLCPNTGTPLAGGFEFEQATHLIQQVVESGRKIIGFDVNEVSPGKDEWDANVGARLLYRIAVMAYRSNEKK